eukprot:scaffold51978_cov53-Attheya_sp.AAC.5
MAETLVRAPLRKRYELPSAGRQDRSKKKQQKGATIMVPPSYQFITGRHNVQKGLQKMSRFIMISYDPVIP